MSLSSSTSIANEDFTENRTVASRAASERAPVDEEVAGTLESPLGLDLAFTSVKPSSSARRESEGRRQTR